MGGGSQIRFLFYKKVVYIRKLLVAQPKPLRKFICTVLNAKKVHKTLFMFMFKVYQGNYIVLG